MTPDEIMRMLTEFLTNHSGTRGKHPESNNPDKYARAIKIDASAETDSSRKERVERMQLLLLEIDHHRRELQDLTDEAKIRFAEIEASKTRFFSLAHKVYPEVATRSDGEDGVGFRTWRGATWLVAWDNEETEKEQQVRKDDDDDNHRTANEGGYI